MAPAGRWPQPAETWTLAKGGCQVQMNPGHLGETDDTDTWAELTRDRREGYRRVTVMRQGSRVGSDARGWGRLILGSL